MLDPRPSIDEHPRAELHALSTHRGFSIEADILRVPAGPGALHVERYGHGGEQVVLLHGFGTSSFLWRTIAPALATEGHTAYAVDLLGYGESDRPFDADYTLGAQAECVDRALSSLRLSRVSLVGIDIGAAVAMQLVVSRPARVARLAMVNPVALDELPSSDVRAVQRGTAKFALRVGRGILGAAALLTPILEKSVADPRSMPPRLVARYLAPFVGSDGVSHLLTLARSVRREDLEGLDPGRIHVPTMIVWAEEDPWIDSGFGERLQAMIAGSTLVRLPGVGRLVPEEASDSLSRLLLEFIVQHAAPTAAPGA
jgi:pimeloyl-ACP methyl ester carboxylesterase